MKPAKRIKGRQPTPRGSLRRRALTAGQTERVAVWLTRDLATRLRHFAVEHRMAISVAVEQALSRYLEAKRT